MGDAADPAVVEQHVTEGALGVARSPGEHGLRVVEDDTGVRDLRAPSGIGVEIETLDDGFSTPTGATAVGETAWVSEGQLPYLLDPIKKEQEQ